MTTQNNNAIVKKFAQQKDIYKIYSRNATIFSGSAFAYYCKEYTQKYFGFKFSELQVNNNEFVEAYVLSSEVEQANSIIRDKIENADSIKDYYEYLALPIFEEFITLGKKLEKKYKVKQSKEDTIQDYSEYTILVSKLLAALYYIFFTDYVIDILIREKIAIHLKNRENEIERYLSIISTPIEKTAVVNERKGFLKLIINKSNKKAFKKHADAYGWFTVYNPSDLRHNVGHYINEAKNISVKSAQEELDKINKDEKEHRIKFDKIISEIKDAKTKKLAILVNWISYYREYRNDIRKEGLSFGYNLLERAGEFIGLSAKEACYLDFNELQNAIRNGHVDKDQIERRIKSFISLGADSENIIIDDLDYVNVIKNIIYNKDKNTETLKGNVAYKGYAKGRAVVITNIKMIKNVKEGDILVASMTAPDYVVAMRKSAAIITDEGGITCHAAVIARELKIPCITGTLNATHLFKTGDQIEVDADKGLIRKIA